MDFFFYGTLMDANVLAAVVGRRISPTRMEAAVIEGYRRVYVAGAWYPMLVPAAGKRVEGCLVFGLGGDAAARIVRFEGRDYDRRAVTVSGARRGSTRALAFLARPGVRPSLREWDPASWRRHHKGAYLRLTQSWLAEWKTIDRKSAATCC